MQTAADREAISFLRSPEAIRARAHAVLDAGLSGQLAHFDVDLDKLDQVAEFVVEVTRRWYPDLAIPYHSRWGHFAVGGIDRMALVRARLDAQLAGQNDAARRERYGRALYALGIVSVLLDAGAGPDWCYREPGTAGPALVRSEGLAVASLHAFLAGAFSLDPERDPLCADAEVLQAIDAETLARHFQAGPENPLVGLEGRAALLNRLGAAMCAAPELFAPAADASGPQLGGLFNHLSRQARGETLPARAILAAVLEGLGPIWNSPVSIGGVGLGDVWPHPAAHSEGPAASAGLMPFHKLSQWLSYSLVEPLEGAGIKVSELDALTGLAEYRNGGLFVDFAVLAPKHARVCDRPHRPGDEIVVEWRALTVALLDRLAEPVRAKLGRSASDMPLTKILEGGTWRAGREIAAQRRDSGRPPIVIDSDGTVF